MTSRAATTLAEMLAWNSAVEAAARIAETHSSTAANAIRDLRVAGDELEEWRQVVGYEGLYDVSSLGRVRSYKRPGLPTIKAVRRAGAYRNVTLYRSNRARCHSVHSLVAAAFIGPRPDGAYVCHNDGCGSNNAATNLRYATPAENQADRHLHGTACEGEKNPAHKHPERMPRGELSGQAKLTQAQVIALRDEHAAGGISIRGIAAKYGISATQARDIIGGLSWAHYLGGTPLWDFSAATRGGPVP